jgi:hypothetical protein
VLEYEVSGARGYVGSGCRARSMQGRVRCFSLLSLGTCHALVQRRVWYGVVDSAVADVPPGHSGCFFGLAWTCQGAMGDETGAKLSDGLEKHRCLAVASNVIAATRYPLPAKTLTCSAESVGRDGRGSELELEES